MLKHIVLLKRLFHLKWQVVFDIKLICFLSIVCLMLTTQLTLSGQSIFQLNLEGNAKLDASAVIPISKKDVNGQQVAAIKIRTNLPNISITASNGVVGNVQFENGAFIAFISPNERKITVGAANYLSLDIILTEVGIRLESGQLWELTVIGKQKSDIVDLAAQLRPLNIRSNPEGATVFIDGVEVQKGKTNVGVLKLPGSYQVRWELAGYLTQTQTIEVTSSQTNDVTAILEQNVGFVHVEVEPTNSKIFVNDVLKNTRKLALTPGNYTIRAVRDGYLPEEKNISVVFKSEQKLVFNLVNNTGHVTWSLQPRDAEVYFNKELALGDSKKLAAGQYVIEVLKKGYKTKQELIQIERGERINKSYILERKRGNLVFDINNIDANVSLSMDSEINYSWNGMRVLNDIPVGDYELNINMKGYKNHFQLITIAEDSTSKITINLVESSEEEVKKIIPMSKSKQRNSNNKKSSIQNEKDLLENIGLGIITSIPSDIDIRENFTAGLGFNLDITIPTLKSFYTKIDVGYLSHESKEDLGVFDSKNVGYLNYYYSSLSGSIRFSSVEFGAGGLIGLYQHGDSQKDFSTNFILGAIHFSPTFSLNARYGFTSSDVNKKYVDFSLRVNFARFLEFYNDIDK